MEHVTDEDHGESVEVAETPPDGEGVEQRLGGVFVHAVPRVDEGHPEARCQPVRGAGTSVSQHERSMSQGGEGLGRIEQALSLGRAASHGAQGLRLRSQTTGGSFEGEARARGGFVEDQPYRGVEARGIGRCPGGEGLGAVEQGEDHGAVQVLDAEQGARSGAMGILAHVQRGRPMGSCSSSALGPRVASRTHRAHVLWGGPERPPDEKGFVRRWFPPSVLVFALALLASIAVHLPAYEALGYLARRWQAVAWRGMGQGADRSVEVEVDFVPPPEAEERTRNPSASKPIPTDPSRLREPRPPPPRRKEPSPPAPAAPRPPVSPPEEPPRRLAVTQRGNGEQAESARFSSREANRVDRETVARRRNLVRDDPDTRPSPPEQGAHDEELAGEREEVVAELRDRDGAPDRRPTREQAESPRPDRPADGQPARRPDPPVARYPTDTARSTLPSGASKPERGAPASREGFALNDGQGTLRFERAGPERSAGANGQRIRRRTARGPRIALLPRHPGDRPSYGELQSIYGEERFEAERQAWLQERRSRRRGEGFGARWEAFRSAIENHVPFVQAGNQTALNAAASPFADYLAAVHRRIHVEYAEKFIGRLPSYSTSPYADRSLRVVLEIAIAPDGSVGRIAVVRSSGLLAFDYGAYAAVMRAQPFPRPPRAIRSVDGRVYFHWGFYRNPRLCGTFNARPFILRSVPGRPPPVPEGPVDAPPQRGPGDVRLGREEGARIP